MKRQKPKDQNQKLEIAISNQLHNTILGCSWTDYDGFSSRLTELIVQQHPKSKAELIRLITGFKSAFFRLNRIKKAQLIDALNLNQLIAQFDRYTIIEISPVTFSDIFSETNNISIDTGKYLIPELTDVAERKIQDTLVDSLREKNATNCRERSRDTVLEVADLEHFSLEIDGTQRTFVAVVKGFKSVSSKSITWEQIAHQITKAYNRTNPDYLLLILAKGLADSVVSELILYSKSIGKENLFIIADPLTLARFLKARNMI
jgi:hypothetical protein